MFSVSVDIHVEGDLGTGMTASSTGVFSGDCPAVAGLFIIPVPFVLVGLKCMSLYAI